MRILKMWILILFLLSFTLGCNSIQEMREAREAVEKANKEAKLILENIKGYAEKAEAASEKAVGAFDKQLKK